MKEALTQDGCLKKPTQGRKKAEGKTCDGAGRLSEATTRQREKEVRATPQMRLFILRSKTFLFLHCDRTGTILKKSFKCNHLILQCKKTYHSKERELKILDPENQNK